MFASCPLMALVQSLNFKVDMRLQMHRSESPSPVLLLTLFIPVSDYNRYAHAYIAVPPALQLPCMGMAAY